MMSDAGSRLVVASQDALDVQQFTVRERMSSLFSVTLVATSENASIDFDAVLGQAASFTLHAGSHERTWSGLCSQLQQIRAEEAGHSTYQLTIVPTLWLATQRRNHRMFQYASELEIALTLLEEWNVDPLKKLSSVHKKRKYRVQYGETDLAFMSRMLEEAGISFYFRHTGGRARLILSDAPHAGQPRVPGIHFKDHPTSSVLDHVTAVRVGRNVRPGRSVLRDHDYRLPPEYKLLASAAAGDGIEQRLEDFDYTPGAFLFAADKGDGAAVSDDRGKTRSDEAEAKLLAERRLDAKRVEGRTCSFDTNALDLCPGEIMTILDHPHIDLAPDKKWLVIDSIIAGGLGQLTHHCEARSTMVPYRPPLSTPKPKVSGVESATVVGPKGEEIHTDEFGRVRVHFHWDRESAMSETSSCWVHVSQAWGGAGYGMINLPRVGQEVIVDFLSGDPDRPVITGRLFTNAQKVPYKLPHEKTKSGWKSQSTHGTGGYNEIMFEDASGRELVNIQAQKDLTKLVKRNESVTVGYDRSKTVRHDDSMTVGHDRTHTVVNDENILVGVNQSITIGANQTITVGANQTITLPSGDQTESITGNRTFTLIGDLTETIQGNSLLTQQGNQVEIVTGSTNRTQVGAVTTIHTGSSTLVQTGRRSDTHLGDPGEVQLGDRATTQLGGRQDFEFGQRSDVQIGPRDGFQLGERSDTQIGGSSRLEIGASSDTVLGPRAETTIGASTETVTGQKKLHGGTIDVGADGTIKVTAVGEITLKGSIIKLNC